MRLDLFDKRPVRKRLSRLPLIINSLLCVLAALRETSFLFESKLSRAKTPRIQASLSFKGLSLVTRFDDVSGYVEIVQ